MRGSYSAFALCVFLTGCCTYTCDVSEEPKYKPWIGKTVRLNDPDEKKREHYVVVVNPDGTNRLTTGPDNDVRAIIAKLSPGDGVKLEAVKRMRQWCLIGRPPSHDLFVVSLKHPTEERRIMVFIFPEIELEPFAIRISASPELLELTEPRRVPAIVPRTN